MKASPGSTRDPLTLQFRDPSLEREFQVEMAATNGPQARVGAAVAVGLWLIAALIIPAVIDVDGRVVTVICIGMAGANLVGVIASRWATTLDRQQAIGFALNGLAGLAVLALIAVSGTTDRYAAPALLLIAIFAFVVIRLRFVFALVAVTAFVEWVPPIPAQAPAAATDTRTPCRRAIVNPNPDEPLSFETTSGPCSASATANRWGSCSICGRTTTSADTPTRSSLVSRAGPMPCDGAWPRAQVDLFERWTEAGKPR